MASSSTLMEYVDPKVLAAAIKKLPQEKVDILFPKRWTVLERVLERFNERMKLLPESERKAMLCMLYKDHAELMFGFLMSIEYRLGADKLAGISNREEQREELTSLLEETKAATDGVTQLYSIE